MCLVFMDNVILILGSSIRYVRCFKSRYVGYRSRLLPGPKRGKEAYLLKKQIIWIKSTAQEMMMWWHQILVTYAEKIPCKCTQRFWYWADREGKLCSAIVIILYRNIFIFQGTISGSTWDVRTMCSFGREEQMSVDGIGTERLEEYLVSWENVVKEESIPVGCVTHGHH